MLLASDVDTRPIPRDVIIMGAKSPEDSIATHSVSHFFTHDQSKIRQVPFVLSFVVLNQLLSFTNYVNVVLVQEKRKTIDPGEECARSITSSTSIPNPDT
jgi:hypothetical protein